MIEKEFERISNDYESTIDQLKKENDRLEKENNFLKENKTEKNNVKPSRDITLLKQNMNEIIAINKSKDEIIKTQADTIKIKNEDIERLKKIKEDLEFKFAEIKSLHNNKEVELEEIYSIIEAILAKKKVKYETHLGMVSEETKERFKAFQKKYNFKLNK